MVKSSKPLIFANNQRTKYMYFVFKLYSIFHTINLKSQLNIKSEHKTYNTKL